MKDLFRAPVVGTDEVADHEVVTRIASSHLWVVGYGGLIAHPAL